MRPDILPKLTKWVSPNDTPDPDPLPKMAGWRILIRPFSLEEKTKSGIYLPDSAREDMEYLMTVGRVLSVGPLAYSRQDMLVDGAKAPWCKVGDYVAYPKFIGSKVEYGGVKMIMANDDEILFVVPDITKIKFT